MTGPAAVRTRTVARPRPLLALAVVVGLACRVAAQVAGHVPGQAPAESSGTVALLCHLSGLLLGVMAYLMLRRWDVWPWLAAVAVLPALWDGRVIAGEQAAGTALAVLWLLSGALLLTCWSRPSRPAIAGAGVLLAAAVTLTAVSSEAAGSALSATATDPPWVRTLLGFAGGIEISLVLLVVCSLVAAAAVAGLGRAGTSPLRMACGAALGAPLLVLLADRLREGAGPSTTTVLVWTPVATALGVTALLRGRRSPAAALPQHDAVDDAAVEDFDRRYGRPALAAVTVVIAAYDEEHGLPAVLDALPGTVCDLAADVVVVDDGSTDRTAAVAEADPRARVVRCGRNRGQGAALRLGYRVAREHGARYVVTIDADGQYDVGDLDAVVRPLLDGRADFVSGSRLLGHQHVQDRVRRAGVHVFAWLVSLLTGRRVTDTSFGLRAMRAEVTGVVTLNQPQYQSSELLIGVLSHGFRVMEVPATMHTRSAGASKKGRNLVYGRRYAGVVLGTWWREGCPRPVGAGAPAVQRQGRR